jgi:DNA repair protein RadD
MSKKTSTLRTIRYVLKKFPNLRYYQKEAIERTALRLTQTTEPLLIVLPTGAGKSWVIAGLAAVIRALSKKSAGYHKKVLVLAPSAELVEQNHAKMTEAGFSASIYSADLKVKDTTGDVVFGSHLSVNKSAEAFVEDALEFALVIIDETHSFIQKADETIKKLSEANPNLRTVGLTATPYRLGQGYIYQRHAYYGQDPLAPGFARDPYFSEVTYEKPIQDMIEEGFLSPPVIGETGDYYDVSKLQRLPTGGFTKQTVDKVFVDGQSTLTASIIKDIKARAQTRRSVMIFCQSRSHAEQVLKLLPPTKAALIDSGTNKTRDRPRIIADFKRGKLKYLVNVNTLSKGFDAPSVDVVALLRHTESPALFQQIIGRGLRLSPETKKRDCLILDYAQNIPPDGDVFSPQIVAPKQSGRVGVMEMVEVECPTCRNTLKARAAKAVAGTVMNKNGFLVLGDNNELVISPDGQPVAGHLAARCPHYIPASTEGQKPQRCKQTWGRVVCLKCETLNSSHAHFCMACNSPISRSALKLGTEAGMDDHYRHRIAELTGSWTLTEGRSAKGNTTLHLRFEVQELPYLKEVLELEDDSEEGVTTRNRNVQEGLVQYEMVTPEPVMIDLWLAPTVSHPKALAQWQTFLEYAKGAITENSESEHDLPLVPNVVKDELEVESGFIKAPRKIVYAMLPKGPNSRRQFFEVINYNYRQKRK